MESSFLSPVEAFKYMEAFLNFERSRKQTIRDYRLDRMKRLLERFDNPQNSFKTIHIAGSKGKGSTAAFIASGLEASGLKTGLYASPHISDYRERITLSGKFFGDSAYTRAAEEIKDAVESLVFEDSTGSSQPTTFELLTLMAFLIFRNEKCEWAVIETGLGGRLDATNIITPEAVVITPVELEHTDILGNTLEQIASEKAGIIKERIPVFSAKQAAGVLNVLKEKAAEKQSSFEYIGHMAEQMKTEITREYTDAAFSVNKGAVKHLKLKALGSVQAENAVLAWFVLNALYLSGTILPGISGEEAETRISAGISRTFIPGRFERITLDSGYYAREIILDGAHTPVSVQKLTETWNRLYSEKSVLIFGSVSDKKTREMAELLVPHFSHIIISTPGTFKESFPEEVAAVFRLLHDKVDLCPEPEKALKKALEYSGDKNLPVLTTGSFYMVAEIRKILIQQKGI